MVAITKTTEFSPQENRTGDSQVRAVTSTGLPSRLPTMAESWTL